MGIPSMIADDADQPAADDAPASRRGIQSVEIGFRVLAALAAEPQPSTLGAVAKRSGLSASQAHRYLASLIASGMAHQDASSGRYDLGPQAIQVGLAALARTDVFAEADPMIAVRWHAGRRPVITSLTVGSVLPLLGSATGHAFLGFMSAEELAGAIEQEKASDPRAADIDVAAIRQRVRKAMSASVDEMLIPGLRATAVPILDIQGHAALVATVMATPAFAREDDDKIVERLKSVCEALTVRLGARWA
jgi:DNA-binding IclR family transcriptional regulator